MRTVGEIDADIAQVKAEMLNVHGTDTEVYARIVGYYRSVRNWNRGKREEYKFRKLFIASDSSVQEHLPNADCACDTSMKSASMSSGNLEIADHYELFVRKTCPNCPPVKECCSNLPLSGTQIDVDSKEGFAKASSNGVVSAPTAIFFDAEGNEVGRAHSVKEIQALSCLIRTAETAPSLI
jgi:ribonucleoside-triphosphate reductase